MQPIDWASRALAKGMLPGFIVGLIVGGVGSRVAMRVMAMTSPAARGFETDFGATVGEITPGGTLFLLIAGGVVGMMGGIVYVAVRPLLVGNAWVKGLLFGGVLLALAGAFLVSPTNPDFVILSPAGLAVAMFSALPVLFGVLFVPLAERLEPAIVGARRSALVILPVLVGLVPLVLLGGVGLIVVAGSLIVWAIGGSIGARGQRVLRSAGYVVLGAVILWRGAAFVDAVTEIL
jgi:hypothetical protein